MKRALYPLAGAVALLAPLRPLTAADPPGYNITRDYPVQVTDAYPTGEGTVITQDFTSYERLSSGEDQWTFEPQVKWGIAKGCDVRASSAFIGGGGDRAGSGNLRLGGTYQFLKRDPWPVLSLQEFVELPTGLHSAGLDTTTNLLLTQPLGQVKPYRRLHLNATWIHNASPGPTERENRYRLVLGYSQQIFKDTVLVADFVIEQQFTMGEGTRLLETGILQKFGKALEVTFGAGAGLGEDSPVVRLGLGVRAKW